MHGFKLVGARGVGTRDVSTSEMGGDFGETRVNRIPQIGLDNPPGLVCNLFCNLGRLGVICCASVCRGGLGPRVR